MPTATAGLGTVALQATEGKRVGKHTDNAAHVCSTTGMKGAGQPYSSACMLNVKREQLGHTDLAVETTLIV